MRVSEAVSIVVWLVAVMDLTAACGGNESGPGEGGPDAGTSGTASSSTVSSSSAGGSAGAGTSGSGSSVGGGGSGGWSGTSGTGGCWAPAPETDAGACDPTKEEHRRQYFGTSEACKSIRIACVENTTYFSNTCGCGCEQAPGCPDFFNCQPGPGAPPCDIPAMMKQCPFSGFAL